MNTLNPGYFSSVSLGGRPGQPAGLLPELTAHLCSLGDANRVASAEILPLVYEDLRRQAASGLARESHYQTLQPTALVHEAWLRLANGTSQQWANRAHFFGAAAQAMRRILIENARRKCRLKRGGRQAHLDVGEIDVAEAGPEENILLINEALEQLREEDAEKARIVELKVFWGCSTTEIAETLGMSERSVERKWTFAKAWLYSRIRQQDAEATA